MDKENVEYIYIYIYNDVFIQSLKRKKFCNVTTWVNLEDIMLSEISSHRRTGLA